MVPAVVPAELLVGAGGWDGGGVEGLGGVPESTGGAATGIEALPGVEVGALGVGGTAWAAGTVSSSCDTSRATLATSSRVT